MQLQVSYPKNDASCYFQKWLKPGGQVLMTTYVVGVNTDHPDDFKDYLSNQRGYNLVTRAKEEELWKRFYPNRHQIPESVCHLELIASQFAVVVRGHKPFGGPAAPN